MIIFCAVWILILGIMCIVTATKGKTSRIKNAYVVGIVSLIWGMAIIGLELLVGIEGSTLALMLGTGLVFTFGSIYGIINIFRCKEKVDAKFIKCNVYHPRGGTVYAPVFQYYFHGVKYECETGQRFSNTYMKKNFKENSRCEIYVCPKVPEINIVKKRIQFFQLVGVLFGIVCIGMAVLIWMSIVYGEVYI